MATPSCPALPAHAVRVSAEVGAAPLRTPWRLPAAVAFPLLALMLFAFFAAASAPSPMFVVLQRAWSFSPSMLTVAYAIYALALLISILVAGSLSDHIGRRPVIFGALVLQAGAMGMFLFAHGIGGLIAARVVQGVATGIASGAMSAAVVEAAPASQKRLGAMVGSVSPLAGLAVGALLTGVAIKTAMHPLPLVFGVLSGLFAAGAVAVLFTRESVTPRAGVLASLVPRVSIPPQARQAFMRAVPVLIATWALGGLYLALAPSVILHVFKVDNGIVNGLTIAVLSGLGAIAPPLLKRLAPATSVTIGMALIVVGTLLLLVALATPSLALFFIATAIGGLGLGAAFSSIVQALAPLPPAHQRADLYAGIFVVSYLAMSVPAMVSGLLVAPLGLLAVVEGYAVLLLVLAVAGTHLQWTAMRRAAAR